MTSPDKPETTDVPAETTRDERTVATASPTPESKPASDAPANGATKPTNTSPASPSAATQPTSVQPKPSTSPSSSPATSTPAAPKPVTPSSSTPSTPARSTPPPATPAPAKQIPASQAVTKPVTPPQPAAKPTPAEPAKPNARPAEEPPTVIAPVKGSQPSTTLDGPDVTSSAPPPWQRVAADAQYVADHELPGDGSKSDSQKTTRFSEWGYQRSPRSSAYAPETGGPVVTGSAASSVFAANAGQSGVHADARPSTDPSARTTVNFGGPPPPQSSMRPATAPPGAAAPSALRRPGRGPRRASLQIKRVDPWSVLKLAFVLSVALFFVWLVAVGVLYGVLDGMGVWDRVNGTYSEFAQNTTSGNSGPLITASRVFGIAAIIGAINIVLFTALATVGSFVYNVSADLAGGLEITLAERE